MYSTRRPEPLRIEKAGVLPIGFHRLCGHLCLSRVANSVQAIACASAAGQPKAENATMRSTIRVARIGINWAG